MVRFEQIFFEGVTWLHSTLKCNIIKTSPQMTVIMRRWKSKSNNKDLSMKEKSIITTLYIGMNR